MNEMLGYFRSQLWDLIFIFVSALLLMFIARFFKLRDNGYRTALFIALVAGVGASFVAILVLSLKGFIPQEIIAAFSWIRLGVYAILGFFLIRAFHKTNWSKTGLVWVVWIVVYYIVHFLLYGALWGLAVALE